MRASLVAVVGLAILIGLLFSVVSLPAKNEQPPFKTVELKSFTLALGVELKPNFLGDLYDDLRSQLEKTGLSAQVVGEGGAVSEADAPASVVMEGKVTENDRGHFVTHVRMEVTVSRLSDRKVLATINPKFDFGSGLPQKKVTGGMAKTIAKDIKNELNKSAGAP
jgi:hypothetical protein